MDNNSNNEIEVITGDGSDLDVSPVYDHLNAAKPKPKDENKKEIIIPKGTGDSSNKKD